MIRYLLATFALFAAVALGSFFAPRPASADVTGYEVVTNSASVSPSAPLYRSYITVACPSGKKALGGGGSTNHAGYGLTHSSPTSYGLGWDIIVQRFSGTEDPVQVNVWVVCGTVS